MTSAYDPQNMFKNKRVHVHVSEPVDFRFKNGNCIWPTLRRSIRFQGLKFVRVKGVLLRAERYRGVGTTGEELLHKIMLPLIHPTTGGRYRQAKQERKMSQDLPMTPPIKVLSNLLGRRPRGCQLPRLWSCFQ